jgi:hypothetical protein
MNTLFCWLGDVTDGKKPERRWDVWVQGLRRLRLASKFLFDFLSQHWKQLEVIVVVRQGVENLDFMNLGLDVVWRGHGGVGSTRSEAIDNFDIDCQPNRTCPIVLVHG